MKIAFVADVHLGNHKGYGGPVVAGINKRCWAVLDALRAAFDMAASHDCEAMVVDGDLFDTSKPPPQLITEVQYLFQQYVMPKYLLLGNHDMESAAPGDHALGPLHPLATIISKPTKLVLKSKRAPLDNVELWAIPFQPGKAEEWLPTVLAEVQGHPSAGSSASSTRVLALHLGLRDDKKTPPWLMDAHDSVPIEMVQELMRNHGIDATYAGNWHNPEEWTYHDADRSVTTALRIVQIGTLCPTGFDNEGLSFGTMAIFDTLKDKNCETLRVPGPRFLKVASFEALKELVNKPKLDGLSVYVRVQVEPEQLVEAEQFIAAVTENGFLAGGEAIPDTTDTQVALRQAAGVARAAETVDEAVAAFVAQMPLPALNDPTLRAEVLAKVKEFLGGST
jgi:hypothetical protein